MSEVLQRSAARVPAAPQVSGYVRDRAGRWRYEADGAYVPGARDVTVGRLWRFARVGGMVRVPVAAIEADPALGWCRAYSASLLVRDRSGQAVAVLVPEADWEDQASAVLGIDAPELAPCRLLDTARVAALLGVAPSTVRAYVVRGYLPPPTVSGLASPLWSRPVLVRHLRAQAQREAVRRAELAAKAAREQANVAGAGPSAPAVRGLAGVDAALARLDADLARLGITVDDDDDDDAGSKGGRWDDDDDGAGEWSSSGGYGEMFDR